MEDNTFDEKQLAELIRNNPELPVVVEPHGIMCKRPKRCFLSKIHKYEEGITGFAIYDHSLIGKRHLLALEHKIRVSDFLVLRTQEIEELYEDLGWQYAIVISMSD